MQQFGDNNNDNIKQKAGKMPAFLFLLNIYKFIFQIKKL